MCRQQIQNRKDKDMKTLKRNKNCKKKQRKSNIYNKNVKRQITLIGMGNVRQWQFLNKL